MSAVQDIGLPYEIVCDTDSRADWLAVRDTGLGASDIGGVLAMPGIGHRSSPLKVYCEKAGILPPEDLSHIEAIEWGHIMEPVIAAQYTKRTGRPAERGRRGQYQVLRSKRYPWAMCSLDFWTADNDNATRRPLEIKNVSAYLADDWVDGTPDYYYAQVQQQLLVTEQDRATSALCLGGNRLLWCDVPRDETMIRQIIARGSELWDRILDRRPPDPDGSAATQETLKRLFSTDDGSSVVLPAALEPIVYGWRDVKEKIAALEKEKVLLENQIKATMGNAQLGVFLNGDGVTWKTQQRREQVVKAGTARPLLFKPSKS